MLNQLLIHTMIQPPRNCQLDVESPPQQLNIYPHDLRYIIVCFKMPPLKMGDHGQWIQPLRKTVHMRGGGHPQCVAQHHYF